MMTKLIDRDELRAWRQNEKEVDVPRLLALAEATLELVDAAKGMVAASVSTKREEWVAAVDRLGEELARIQGNALPAREDS